MIGIQITIKTIVENQDSNRMSILILNFNVSGFAGDAKQPLLIAKGLIELGHNVVYVVPDGDGWFFDENNDFKNYIS